MALLYLMKHGTNFLSQLTDVPYNSTVMEDSIYMYTVRQEKTIMVFSHPPSDNDESPPRQIGHNSLICTDPVVNKS